MFNTIYSNLFYEICVIIVINHSNSYAFYTNINIINALNLKIYNMKCI